MLNRNTDIIRDGDKDYVNINTKNRLIKALLGTSAEDIYEFNILFGSKVDSATQKEMSGTYLLRTPQSDNKKYQDDVQIAVL